jgi:hypothetical protein
MNISNFPTVVDVTLYRYNHLDNRLWVKIKNDLDYIEVDEDSVIVDIDQLRKLIEVNYAPMINRIKSVGADFLHKKVNSPYFIYRMLDDLTNLKYLKITKSYDKEFTRILEIDGDKILKFDFKILSMTIRLHDWFYTKELRVLNPILEELEILEDGVPYKRIKLVEMLDLLDIWVSKEIDQDVDEDTTIDPIPLVTELMDLIDPKIERDNPLVLLVTDY